MPLTNTKVKQASAKEKTYRLSDEKGLYLEISPRGSKYWRMKYRFGGKEKRLAFGVYPQVSLKEARHQRDKAKLLLQEHVDPSAAKKAAKISEYHIAENCFEAVANEWFETQMKSKAPSHQRKVERLMEINLFPAIGGLDVKEITPPTLLAALRKVEARGAIETAHRVKQISGQVFRYAIATGRCERDPSADLRGALTAVKTKHLAAIIKPKEVGQLLIAIDHYQGTPSVMGALKLAPLLFVRPGELRQMEWQEIDWDRKRWEIPVDKMKMREPHIVPLAKQAIDLLRDQERITGRGKYVFPNARSGNRPLSENGLLVALRTMGYTNEMMTPHGFRAMARTLLDEELGFRVEWIEQQLAHAVKDANGRAYNRTKHLKQRTEMMQVWADYLDDLKK